MQVTRHHYLALGIVLLLMGVQFRLVDSVMLNKETSQFIAKKIEARKKSGGVNSLASMLSISMPTQQRTVEPPKWVGWALVSIGGVLLLHALAMKNPA